MNDEEIEARLLGMRPALFAVAGRFFSCAADREDAVQECLCWAWQFRKDVRNPDAFEAWVVRVMKNVCAAMCRERAPCAPLAEETRSPGDDPVGRWIEADALYGALQALPAERRAVVCGHYLSGRTLRELSEATGVRMGTVQSWLYRSLRQLKKTVG